MLRYWILFLVFLPFYLTAQSIEDANQSEYIEKMNHILNLKLGIDNDVESFVYGDKDFGYSVKPNTSLRTSIALNYRFIAFTIGYTPKFLANSDTEEKGKTKTFRMKADIFVKNWLQSIEYNKISGYYVDNFVGTGNNVPSFDEIVILPSLKTKNISGITRYKFNDNFSFKASRNQTEIQRKSAGSFIPSLSYGYFQIKDNEGFQDLSSYWLSLNAGYHYTFVINKKWYSNLGFAPGLGYEFNKLVNTSNMDRIINRDNDWVANIQSQIGLGYNSKSLFSGAKLVSLIKARDEKSIINFSNSRVIFEFYVGYRFNPPKFLKKGVDWIEEQNPLN